MVVRSTKGGQKPNRALSGTSSERAFMTMDDLWTQFLLHLKVERRSPATLGFYGVTRRTLERFAAEARLPDAADAVTTAHLRAFVLWLGAQGLGPGGVHAHVRAVRACFNWAAREELLARNPAGRLELPKLPRQRLPAVTPEQVPTLLRAAKAGDQPLRDTAVVLTLFDTGLRVSELVALRQADVLAGRGLLRVEAGKGEKERVVPVGTKALTAITAYARRERRPQHAGVQHLFLARHGLPMTRSGIGIRLNTLAKRAGLSRADVAPHAFRRGFAVGFLRNGGDVFTLQQILGHASLEMTRRYVAFLDDDLKLAHLRFSPGDRL